MYIAIFRMQLFKSSETFIPAQVRHLQRHVPVYVGRKLLGDQGDAHVVLSSSGFVPTLRTVLLRDMDGWPDALLSLPVPPRIVHAHFAIDAVYALPLARKLDIPLITTLHGFDVTRSRASLLRSGRPALVNAVIYRRELQRDGSLFICVSQAIRPAALALGFPAEKLLVHYIGIDTDRIVPRQGAGEEGLILHVARLVEKKGTIFLLRALARISSSRPMARLVIIGDGPLRASLEAEALALGLSGRVQFLGARPNSEVLDWDARAAIKAVPSVTGSDGDQEGLPTVVTETMALGVPVVGFDSGGISEAVVHGETGLLSPERDVDGLARHLALLLDNAELRQRFGAAARVRAVAEFDVKRQTAKLEEIYDCVAVARQ